MYLSGTQSQHLWLQIPSTWQSEHYYLNRPDFVVAERDPVIALWTLTDREDLHVLPHIQHSHGVANLGHGFDSVGSSVAKLDFLYSIELSYVSE
jgi:hypothetical protein